MKSKTIFASTYGDIVYTAVGPFVRVWRVLKDGSFEELHVDKAPPEEGRDGAS